MKLVYFKIEGRVQRIGFRRWAVSKAMEIGGISGWVRNVEDGSVEILIKGEEYAVNKMIAECYQGPLFARVDKISFLSEAEICYLPQIKEGCFVRI